MRSILKNILKEIYNNEIYYSQYILSYRIAV